jgi:hypothetical protein
MESEMGCALAALFLVANENHWHGMWVHQRLRFASSKVKKRLRQNVPGQALEPSPSGQGAAMAARPMSGKPR